jgi:dolichyl-phosphate-mannose--protein O-mannosyl transferase
MTRKPVLIAASVACLLIILSLQLLLSIRQESQTWDEANHIYAGYRSWSDADFGLNPEHPPMVKLLATIPLLSSPLTMPKLEDRFFKEDAFLGGKQFLYQNNADEILLRTRIAAATLTILLALIVFFGTKEMFGTGAAFIALTLLVFDPNLLAHGALVTTDAALSCFMFASVYAFFRYVKAPSLWRLSVVGIATGLALAAKHTGLLVLPMLLLLSVCEVVRYLITVNHQTMKAFGKHVLKIAGSMVVISVIAGGDLVGLLWFSLCSEA